VEYSIEELNAASAPLIPVELLEGVARRFRYLGDPTRLRVLSELHAAGEASVGELARRSGVPLASVSQHLNRLADGGLVERRREGTSVIYAIADPTIGRLCELVCGTLVPGGS
jgi:ArsR family transcriptional regulator